MKTDDWRLHYTYWIAIGVLAGIFGLIILKLPEISSETLVAFVAGLASGVMLFVFNRETGAGQARATERAMAQGANTATPTTVNASGDTTVTGGDPTNVTVAKK